MAIPTRSTTSFQPKYLRIPQYRLVLLLDASSWSVNQWVTKYDQRRVYCRLHIMDQIGATCFAKRCFTNCDSHLFDMIKNNDIHTSKQKNCVTACLQIISGSVMSLELMIKHQQANLTCTEFPSYPRKILANLAIPRTPSLCRNYGTIQETRPWFANQFPNQFGSRGKPVRL